MAELPKEMEDIVGKLMEDEEDLFDEMEDASSSWADSIDKGAGWDAMDGPISNNSARGVTGNRLPNSSEIAGRSGEGRQGKSSGEFVGDTAVGKGGRKTPSRLTPDPFVKGQVKDFSKDPSGSTSGGGKESGQGGKGLHGPVPNRPHREMARLAENKPSSATRPKALIYDFKVMKYHHTDLQEDDRHHGRGRIRPQIWPLSYTPCVAATSFLEGSGSRSNPTSRANSRCVRIKRPILPTEDPERNPGKHARAVAKGVGGASTGSILSG